MATKVKTKSKAKARAGAVQKNASKQARQEIVRKELLDAQQLIEENYISLAQLLSEAYHKEFHLEWGFNDFREYCDAELGVDYRKAMYLVDIWDKIKGLGLPKGRVAKLGWTKMKDIAAVINEKNAKEWLDKAEKMTSRELTEAVKIIRKKDTSGTSVPTVTTMTLRMSESEANVITEAIEEAKKLIENDNSVVALEMICQDWLEAKGTQPEVTTITDHVDYLEKVYGVTITFKNKKASKKKSEAAKASETVKEAGEKAEAREDGKGEQDIDELLGL